MNNKPVPVKDSIRHLVDSLMLDGPDGVSTYSWEYMVELSWSLKDRKLLSELAKQLILDGLWEQAVPSCEEFPDTSELYSCSLKDLRSF